MSAALTSCSRCPRLVRWRQAAAAEPPARHRGERYWARPVPGTGDSRAALLVLGLAPAAHGGNRTGRPFTGDGSGTWLHAALERNGFLRDGKLRGCWVTNAVKCAPPGNRPTPRERDACLRWLRPEAEDVAPQVVVALGAFAWDCALRVWLPARRPRPSFSHGAEVGRAPALLGSYHPSRQNTNTGRLTVAAFDAVFARAAALLR